MTVQAVNIHNKVIAIMRFVRNRMQDAETEEANAKAGKAAHVDTPEEKTAKIVELDQAIVAGFGLLEGFFIDVNRIANNAQFGSVAERADG